MSPSRSRRRAAGIPCTTSSLIEAQIVAGNPRYPLKAGFAFRSRIRASTSRSISSVETPGFTRSRHTRKASARIRPASRMWAIWAGDFSSITAGPRSPSTRSAWTVSIVPARGDRRQEAAPPVVVDEGPGVARVHGEPPADRGLLVVRPLVELPPAVVAAPRRPGRRERDVVVPAAAPADPASAEPRHRLLVGHLEEHHPVEGRPLGLEQLVERLRLRRRPREAVQDEPLPAVRLGEPLADESDDHRVGDQLARVHVAPGLEPEPGAVRDGLPQHVPGRDLRHAPARGEPARLRSLPGPRRSQQHDPHLRPGPSCGGAGSPRSAASGGATPSAAPCRGRRRPRSGGSCRRSRTAR